MFRSDPMENPMTATLEAPVAVPPSGTQADTARETTYPGRWLGLFALLAATLMNLLDASIVTLAAPAIRADLGGSLSTLQWLTAGYTLALAVGLLTGGRLGDMYGRKRMLTIGIVGFVAASLACALAPSAGLLLLARVVQGVFGAVMIPQGFGLIRDMFGKDVGKAFGAFGPAIGLATILGPIVAGVLVDADIFGTGWRMIFLINLPLGAFALIAGLKVLPAGAPSARGQKLDVKGAALAAVGMFALTYPLVEGRELGWPAWTIVLLAAAALVLGAFGVQQWRRARTGRPTLIELSVFAKRSYTSGVGFVVVFFGAIIGFSLAAGLFLQLGLGFTALDASIAMAPWAVGAFVGSGVSAGLMTKLGRRIVHIGLIVMAVGLVAVATVVSAESGTWDLVGPFAVFGLGMGMIFVPLFDIIVADLDDHEVGSASGLLESFQQLGSSLGVAVLGTVFFEAIGSRPDAASFAGSAELVTWLAVGLTAVTFAVGFLLPQKARAGAHG